MAKPADVPTVAPITQVDLADALAEGKITQAEIDHVWRETEYLSPQTPIEIRQAIVNLEKAGHHVSGAEQVILQTVMDLRAALYRDGSSFQHLVAGTETIVDKLQAINKWEALVERLETRLDETNVLVERLVELRERPRRTFWQWLLRRDPDTDDEETYITMEQPGVEEDVDRKIGSNWDSNNPRKE